METVGRPVPGTDVKISDEGEILVKGDQVFKGYYKDPGATSRAINEGWFHTGDAGFFDDNNGHLIFLDRLADLTELAGGAKVAPQYIESRLRFSPYIKDAITIADKEKSFVSTLVTISFENVGRWVEKNKIPYTTYIDLSQKKEVYNLIYKEILRVNKDIPKISRIQKFVLLHKEFDPDESELTRTRKLRRDFIKNRYSELIAGIYGGMTEIPVTAQVKYRDGRTAEVRTGVRVMNVDEG
jgi:long-chain acyl-CoA synthetase